MTLVLIIDDVKPMAEQYAYDLKRVGGFETMIAGSGAEGLEALATEPVDCAILDLEMPGMDGFEVLQALGDRGVDVPVIVYTGTGNFERCVRAIQLGAAGFVDKGEPMERVVREIGNVLEKRRLASELTRLKEEIAGESALVGSGAAMRDLHGRIRKLASIPSPVLVLGESGSGKELVARDLHSLGRHPESPFLAVNCAALAENLVESELFGHERGAFTGASAMRKGAFEAAQDGTIFLDEIGELPLPTQAKLLRVLEQNEITRVGGNRTISVLARVVAATHRDLDSEVGAGRFREDLLYRLNVHTLSVPPLRERAEDIPELVEHFLDSICKRLGYKRKTMNPAAVAALASIEWRKNNVRELRNTVERMIIAADGDVIGTEEVLGEGRRLGGSEAQGGEMKEQSLAAQKTAAEKAIILRALNENEWQITNTARQLGLADHASLLKIMRRLGIKRVSR